MVVDSSASDEDAAQVVYDTTDVFDNLWQIVIVDIAVVLHMEGEVHDILDVGVRHDFRMCVAPCGASISYAAVWIPWAHAHG